MSENEFPVPADPERHGRLGEQVDDALSKVEFLSNLEKIIYKLAVEDAFRLRDGQAMTGIPYDQEKADIIDEIIANPLPVFVFPNDDGSMTTYENGVQADHQNYPNASGY